METLLQILLYMGMICSPCEYHVVEINHMEMIHQHEIQVIENDEPLMWFIEEEYKDDSGNVVVHGTINDRIEN